MAGRVRGYLGMSLDGRIAGPNDELDWLEEDPPRAIDSPVPTTPDDWLSFEDFTADVGAMLMGRRTFDVVLGFDSWYYGELAIVVATNRALPDKVPDTVTTASGSIPELVEIALERADGKDVYVDGGRLVSAVLDAGLLDEITTTVLPTVQGPGIGLFTEVKGPHRLDLTRVAVNEGGAVQLTWVPHERAS